jgi:lipid-A-disaccharide synthase
MKPLKIAIISGEESGDLLGADLARALQASYDLRLVGVGGSHLQALGLETLADPDELALMGVTAIVKRLPRLVALIGRVSRAIIAAKPDVLVIIDSPEFTHRVARRVRAAMPSLPVFNYVCPSVWAWRPGRAPAMRAYVDEVFCLLPFEPGALARLDGPRGTFVGHRLMNDPSVQSVRAARVSKTSDAAAPRHLLLLPGSRSGEINRLLPDMLETARLLHDAGSTGKMSLVTLPRHRQGIEQTIAASGLPVEVATGDEAKWRIFAEADAAIAASGTVSLELGLCGVPHCSIYRLDLLARLFIQPQIKSWSANLINLIADEPVVPELYGDMVRPQRLQRVMRPLLTSGHFVRNAQLAGFAAARAAMRLDRPAAQIAAERIIRRVSPPQI